MQPILSYSLTGPLNIQPKANEDCCKDEEMCVESLFETKAIDIEMEEEWIQPNAGNCNVHEAVYEVNERTSQSQRELTIEERLSHLRIRIQPRKRSLVYRDSPVIGDPWSMKIQCTLC